MGQLGRGNPAREVSLAAANDRDILVVEDEPLVRELLVMNLEHAGYRLTAVASAAEAEKALAERRHALAIVDVMLPGPSDGFELVLRARAKGATLPVLMLTARGGVEAKVRGLDAGADDYLTKPFDVEELLARVRALLRRRSAGDHGASGQGRRLTLGKRWVKLDTGEADTNEGPLVLSEKELRLLRMFESHEGQVLSRADILEEVWGMDSFPSDRTVDNFVLRLRKLLEPQPDEPIHFVTLRSRGYMFRLRP